MASKFQLPLIGRCQCRKIVYGIAAAPLAVYACHCTECQRQSGSAFSLSLVASRESVSVKEGKARTWQRQHESGRRIDCVLCAECGTRLFHEPHANPKITIVKPGTLDDTTWLFPAGHIWTRSALAWIPIPGDGANYEAQPPNLAGIVDAWQRYQSGVKS